VRVLAKESAGWERLHQGTSSICVNVGYMFREFGRLGGITTS
jgi:hypothetical protein